MLLIVDPTGYPSLVYTVETYAMSDCVCQERKIEVFHLKNTRGTLILREPPIHLPCPSLPSAT